MPTDTSLTCDQMAEAMGDWPNCPTPDCPNKICLSRSFAKCWPCTVGLPVRWYVGLSEKERTLVRNEAELLYFARRGTAPLLSSLVKTGRKKDS